MKKLGSESQSSSQFSQDLQAVVGALVGDSDPWVQIIFQYDASQLDDSIRLIASVPGDYNETSRLYGLKRRHWSLPPVQTTSTTSAMPMLPSTGMSHRWGCRNCPNCIM